MYSNSGLFQSNCASNVRDSDSSASNESCSNIFVNSSDIVPESSYLNDSFFIENSELEIKMKDQCSTSDMFSVGGSLSYFDEWRQQMYSCSDRIEKSSNTDKFTRQNSEIVLSDNKAVSQENKEWFSYQVNKNITFLNNKTNRDSRLYDLSQHIQHEKSYTDTMQANNETFSFQFDKCLELKSSKLMESYDEANLPVVVSGDNILSPVTLQKSFPDESMVSFYHNSDSENSSIQGKEDQIRHQLSNFHTMSSSSGPPLQKSSTSSSPQVVFANDQTYMSDYNLNLSSHITQKPDIEKNMYFAELPSYHKNVVKVPSQSLCHNAPLYTGVQKSFHGPDTLNSQKKHMSCSPKMLNTQAAAYSTINQHHVSNKIPMLHNCNVAQPLLPIISKPLVKLQPARASINITDVSLGLGEIGIFNSLCIRNISSELFFSSQDFNGPVPPYIQYPRAYCAPPSVHAQSQSRPFLTTFQELKINDAVDMEEIQLDLKCLKQNAKPRRLKGNRKKEIKESFKGCRFCISNYESRDIFASHTLKKKIGNRTLVTCPILRKLVCDVCGGTGDKAHTRSYCPLLIAQKGGQKPISVANEIKKTKRFASGKIRRQQK